MTPQTSISCYWCTSLVTPQDTRQVEVKDDDNSELPTGTVQVCRECIEALESEK